MKANAAAPAAIRVLDDARRMSAVLAPLRRRILAAFGDKPDSAAGLARRLGVARQKVNYHVRALESAGLVSCTGTRRRRGCVERLMRPTARALVVSPAFLSELGADPDALKDRFSSEYLMASASRTLRDVALLRARAEAVEKPLTTLAMEIDAAFASPADLTAFADGIAAAVAGLVRRFHKPAAKGARRHRFTISGHPVVTKSEADAAAEAAEHRARKERP